LKKAFIIALGLACTLAFHTGSAFAASKMDEAIDKVVGTPYKYSGTTTKGFDCSGFTMYVFKQLGIELPHSSKAQAKLGAKVAKEDLKAGDLVFFNTDGSGISHVGIYVGDGKFAHSSSSDGVTIDKLSDTYYAKRYVKARRVMNADTYEKVATEPSDDSDSDADTGAESDTAAK